MWIVVAVTIVGCGAPPPEANAPASNSRAFVAMKVESDAFPKSAELATSLLGRARLRDFDPPTMTKVSLETVQLSIECNDPTIDCYVAVGRAVSAHTLLFGVIEPGPSPGSLKFTANLLDVDGKKFIHRASKVFPSEDDAAYDMKLVVNEATKP